MSNNDRLSRSEISQLMRTRGFAELSRHWKRFLRFGIEPAEIDEAKLNGQRHRHMQPLLGKPKLVATLLCILSVVLSFGLANFSGSAQSATELFATVFTSAVMFFAILALSIYVLTTVQRYLVSPMENLLSFEVALMLSIGNFGAWVNATAEAKMVVAQLQALGVNETWDDPRYRATYAQASAEYERIQNREVSELALTTLREFIGQKVDRRHVPGINAASLRNGKKSISQIVAEFPEELEAAKNGTISSEQALRLLRGLLAQVNPERACYRELELRISALESDCLLRAGEVQAAIWQRDPWVDLTHQTEFFSSASLRGVHPMGRGHKGRLGTFGYLRTKAISALDFRTRRGRIVRVRMGAAKLVDDTEAILFVDGVEGSNSLAPVVIKAGIEDYARACGFKFVLYNAHAHNKVPQRFVAYVAGLGTLHRYVNVLYLDLSQLQYLDAFGYPIEPFEYHYPHGGVIGYLSVLDSTVQRIPGSTPTLLQTLAHWSRRNALWLVVAGSVGFATARIYTHAPQILLPFALLIGTLIFAHLRYQLKGLRT